MSIVARVSDVTHGLHVGWMANKLHIKQIYQIFRDFLSHKLSFNQKKFFKYLALKDHFPIFLYKALLVKEIII